MPWWLTPTEKTFWRTKNAFFGVSPCSRAGAKRQIELSGKRIGQSAKNLKNTLDAHFVNKLFHTNSFFSNMHACHICHKQYKQKRNLNRHLQTHAKHHFNAKITCNSTYAPFTINPLDTLVHDSNGIAWFSFWTTERSMPWWLMPMAKDLSEEENIWKSTWLFTQTHAHALCVKPPSSD